MNLWTIGVDPGKEGGMTIFLDDKLTSVHALPFVGKDLALRDIMVWCERLNLGHKKVGWDHWHAWIEEAQAFPGKLKPEKCRKCGLVTMRRQAQGVVSTGTFMRGAGLIEGCFIGMGIDCTRIKAKAWQKIMLTGMRGRAALKAASIAQARQLFPSVTFKRTQRCRTYSDGMTDSALIAVCGSRITVV